MATCAEDDFVTLGAPLIRHVLLNHEEHEPLPDGAEPATLLARTLLELAQAAGDIHLLIDDWAVNDEDDELEDSEDARERPTAGQVALRFACVAAWTLRAAAHIHPAIRDQPPTQAKDRLLKALDGDAGDWIDERENWDDLGSEDWLRLTLMLLSGAGEHVCKLAGMELRSDSEVDDDEDSHAAAVAASLLQAGHVAAAAVQWFLELAYEIDDETDE